MIHREGGDREFTAKDKRRLHSLKTDDSSSNEAIIHVDHKLDISPSIVIAVPCRLASSVINRSSDGHSECAVSFSGQGLVLCSWASRGLNDSSWSRTWEGPGEVPAEEEAELRMLFRVSISCMVNVHPLPG